VVQVGVGEQEGVGADRFAGQRRFRPVAVIRGIISAGRVEGATVQRDPDASGPDHCQRTGHLSRPAVPGHGDLGRGGAGDSEDRQHAHHDELKIGDEDSRLSFEHFLSAKFQYPPVLKSQQDPTEPKIRPISANMDCKLTNLVIEFDQPRILMRKIAE